MPHPSPHHPHNHLLFIPIVLSVDLNLTYLINTKKFFQPFIPCFSVLFFFFVGGHKMVYKGKYVLQRKVWFTKESCFGIKWFTKESMG